MIPTRSGAKSTKLTPYAAFRLESCPMPDPLQRATSLSCSPLDAPSLTGDTVHLPGTGPDGTDTVVRPALAVFYRIAVGPGADRYAPRFLSYERSGHARPGWHWPALLAPAAWAFYRRLWGAGILYTLLPLAGLAAFMTLAPRFDGSALLFWGAAVVTVWLLPNLVPALVADALLYLRARREVRAAEAGAGSASDALKRLSVTRPTSPLAGILGGGMALALAASLAAPNLELAEAERAVRAQVGTTLDAVKALQVDVEAALRHSDSLPRPFDALLTVVRAGGTLAEAVDVHPATGRVRVALGSAVPALAGKAILLAPAVDAREQVRWTCIPVDIPRALLPAACR